MTRESSIAIFGQQNVRRHWDAESELWYFSVIDIIQALTQQKDFQAARNYWKVLKTA